MDLSDGEEEVRNCLPSYRNRKMILSIVSGKKQIPDTFIPVNSDRTLIPIIPIPLVSLSVLCTYRI